MATVAKVDDSNRENPHDILKILIAESDWVLSAAGIINSSHQLKINLRWNLEQAWEYQCCVMGTGSTVGENQSILQSLRSKLEAKRIGHRIILRNQDRVTWKHQDLTEGLSTQILSDPTQYASHLVIGYLEGHKVWASSSNYSAAPSGVGRSHSRPAHADSSREAMLHR